MPIKLHPQKICTIPYTDKDDPSIEFEMTFKFPYTEDKPIDEGNEHPIAYILKVAKDAIVSTKGIIDETTGEEIVLTDDTRKLLYDFIKTVPDYIFMIAAAFMGPKGKNWLTGVMGLLTTDGHRVNADHVSQIVEENVSSSSMTIET